MTSFPINTLREQNTPFYYYDTALLRKTLETLTQEAAKHENFVVHYAVKANTNPNLLTIINEYGLGADCVSGGEIEAVLNAGFPADRIVFAGVGKSDWEINLALDHNIFCFNVESLPELLVINQLAAEKNLVAQVCLRVNPDVAAHTHAHITTGLAENKFGIALQDFNSIVDECMRLENVNLVGLHFHIGSQILDMSDYCNLCMRVNELQDQLEARGIKLNHINVGGGLGISYDQPDQQPIPDFAAYFQTFADNLSLREGQTLHFEPGRSVVAQCGTLITKVLYVKQGTQKQFAIVDAGFTELIRPAFYDAYHKIENLTSQEPEELYDVVGPICESSDVFAKQIALNKCQRGDLIAIRSAGAYGEIMSSHYNCRHLNATYYAED